MLHVPHVTCAQKRERQERDKGELEFRTCSCEHVHVPLFALTTTSNFVPYGAAKALIVWAKRMRCAASARAA